MAGLHTLRAQSGQVSVSLVAVVPALIVAVLAAIQFGLAGHAALSAANAARAAARASYAGADPSDAARAALPSSLREGAEVTEEDEAERVAIEAPRALPFLPAITVSSSAQLEPPDGVPDG
jgi:TadE-like protein